MRSLFRDIIMVSTTDALALMRDNENAPVETEGRETGAEALDAALSVLLQELRDRRAQIALKVTGRIAHRALSHTENGAPS